MKKGTFKRSEATLQLVRIALTKHGHAGNSNGKGRSLTYSTWNNMMSRCNNPNATGYKNYGGRGIIVVKRWKTFTNFLADMGERSDKDYSIDRINNDGNYTPNNCRWITKAENSSKAHKGIPIFRPLFPKGYAKKKAA